ncbi:hypothetical protein ACH5RR_039906 [Cinchona calisaya]|uniref:Mitochondrial distribution/morphology family 35/apoptosis n=1 Tax=Cinchona calisaya TaxID=153742 RepID=A0ABD2Y0V9_9GENT
MGILREKKNTSLATSPCAQLRDAYHNCFNRWYSEKFLKGQWDKEECVSEWQKYRECLSQHLDDKHLSRFLEADGIADLMNPAGSKIPDAAPK